MNPSDRLRLDLVAARYLAALEQGDFVTMEEIWKLASSEPQLEAALNEVHTGLLEEQGNDAARAMLTAVTAAVETHLPSAEILRPPTGPVCVAHVAEELFRHPPERLPGEVHLLNEQLRTSQEPLPEDLALPALIIWAEQRFGAAPAEYWKAFRKAAVKLELRRAAEAEYQLAARPAPRPEGNP